MAIPRGSPPACAGASRTASASGSSRRGLLSSRVPFHGVVSKPTHRKVYRQTLIRSWTAASSHTVASSSLPPTVSSSGPVLAEPSSASPAPVTYLPHLHAPQCLQDALNDLAILGYQCGLASTARLTDDLSDTTGVRFVCDLLTSSANTIRDHLASGNFIEHAVQPLTSGASPSRAASCNPDASSAVPSSRHLRPEFAASPSANPPAPEPTQCPPPPATTTYQVASADTASLSQYTSEWPAVSSGDNLSPTRTDWRSAVARDSVSPSRHPPLTPAPTRKPLSAVDSYRAACAVLGGGPSFDWNQTQHVVPKEVLIIDAWRPNKVHPPFYRRNLAQAMGVPASTIIETHFSGRGLFVTIHPAVLPLLKRVVANGSLGQAHNRAPQVVPVACELDPEYLTPNQQAHRSKTEQRAYCRELMQARLRYQLKFARQRNSLPERVHTAWIASIAARLDDSAPTATHSSQVPQVLPPTAPDVSPPSQPSSVPTRSLHSPTISTSTGSPQRSTPAAPSTSSSAQSASPGSPTSSTPSSCPRSGSVPHASTPRPPHGSSRASPAAATTTATIPSSDSPISTTTYRDTTDDSSMSTASAHSLDLDDQSLQSADTISDADDRSMLLTASVSQNPNV